MDICRSISSFDKYPIKGSLVEIPPSDDTAADNRFLTGGSGSWGDVRSTVVESLVGGGTRLGGPTEVVPPGRRTMVVKADYMVLRANQSSPVGNGITGIDRMVPER